MLTLSKPCPNPHLLTYKPKTRPISLPLQISNSSLDPKRRTSHKAFSISTSQTSNTSYVSKQAKPVQLKPAIGMWTLCGLGYCVQGFRCFPWLGLNFHLAQGIGLSPGALQLVQNFSNLPLVAKPLFGVISDAVYIGGAHRLPYISIGVCLQLVSWGTLALIPPTANTFPTQMACIILSNVGASVTEVATDALVTEFSRAAETGELQSYAFIALSAGSLLGNLSGGYALLYTHDPKLLFMTFSFFLVQQLSLALSTKERTIERRHIGTIPLWDNLQSQISNFVQAVSERQILYPLCWIIGSVAFVPILSGSIFCFQTQILNLDPSIIGLSKVVGQLFVISATLLYNRFLKRIPLRTLVSGLQVMYAFALLSDLLLVKQINLSLGISNEIYVLSLSALAEAIAQFKLLPFTVLLSSLCPRGCEGSLLAFFASGVVLASIVGGFLGVGLSCLIGVSAANYSNLPVGIIVQFLAALVPFCWISCLPLDWSPEDKKVRRNDERKRNFLLQKKIE
ncbi:Major facilitator superfamily protein [Rhynchospora pubera]|uniref:Major facilitator superfamily protein n=1 Tax=Rhynchospora pubera TaxID=906938 RepID=A0AAV8GQQ3_9POAL|nr:Major facilitator superfamily protein [Rhynchospora pubera]